MDVFARAGRTGALGAFDEGRNEGWDDDGDARFI